MVQLGMPARTETDLMLVSHILRMGHPPIRIKQLQAAMATRPDLDLDLRRLLLYTVEIEVEVETA